MTTEQRKTTSHHGQTSRTSVGVCASTGKCKHVAKTQATLAGAFTNLKAPKKRLSYVQKKLEKINFCKELACAEAKLKKR